MQRVQFKKTEDGWHWFLVSPSNSDLAVSINSHASEGDAKAEYALAFDHSDFGYDRANDARTSFDMLFD